MNVNTCFRDFLIIGCGLSSSSENARVLGSKSRPDDAIDNAIRQYITHCIHLPHNPRSLVAKSATKPLILFP